MDTLDLARWQFGITTVYHFIFVPLTIGLAPLVAVMQTAWVRTGHDHWLRMTRFFGELLLINFAIGVVTGIVQEFQFGMAWSEYSRFVGDVFGAPLAIEGLAAFFVESTFLGLWIFGWGRLPKLVHLGCIWAVALAVNASAFFILAANSWMQHPVGVTYNPTTGRAEMTDIGAVLTNPTLLAAFPHTVTGALVVAGTFVAGVSGWWCVHLLRREGGGRVTGRADAAAFRPALVVGLVALLVGGVGVAVSGDAQAKLMFAQQPMKMAAAEALCDTETGAGFSLIAVGDVGNNCDVRQLTVPGLTSWLATGDTHATLEGVRAVQARYVELYGPANYTPLLPVTYWTFRLMIGFGVFSAALALAALWLLRRGRTPSQAWFGRLSLLALPMPFLANATGWVFTEMGRQPWVVAPNPTGPADVRLLTAQGVSRVDSWEVAISLVALTAVYGVLAAVWFGLIRRAVSHGAPSNEEVAELVTATAPLPPGASPAERPLPVAY
ncbi:cytochrome bd-I ubiquinol oxidase subunit 1 apoprotein [Quadrisphaera granulorum]|uniref:Cytochrome bd-I ubiquinol oxidase subunit 1 apoprotein n=1 Tax=Quadrisphaera granulorum TaxID=317664 RepID=A0A315ZTE8_9ACTN|nr:cytochrome ubiquinol oxidase subunit I [Quadrisphaera granulorum]PWJ48841.1 cytochrome bd-I ubiquinol oxidase subunit 1 apoprotein [Quadrisphaera granulorum]SZE98323.1 cytochrome bd-I ubiquinol oxidase subunit 1 apoprotein [Quadrisphaera granulorum]